MNMTNGTAAYDLSSLDAGTYPANFSVLTILGVEVLDNGGIWHPLRPITLDYIHSQGLAQAEYYKTNGRPAEYEKREHMLVLYPAPDNGITVTLSAGLKVFFLRAADGFTSSQVTTGTKEPGFPAPWHDIISYEAAYMYAIAKGLENRLFLKAEMDRKEKELFKFISRRNQDDRPVMTMMVPNFI